MNKGEAPTDGGCHDLSHLASSRRPEQVQTTGQRQAMHTEGELSWITFGAAYPLRQDESRHEPLLAGSED